jgi:hypothetical protein
MNLETLAGLIDQHLAPYLTDTGRLEIPGYEDFTEAYAAFDGAQEAHARCSYHDFKKGCLMAAEINSKFA